MNDIFRRAYGISVKAAGDSASRAFDVIASTDDVDLEGEVLIQDWDLRRYVKNPVVLYAHNLYGMWGGEAEDSLPVGFASNVMIADGKLVATINFVDAAASEMAERCYQGFKQGSLRAVSVGFRPKQGSVEMRNGQDVYVLRGNELLEISVCPVPCNPNAVATEERAKSIESLRALTKSPKSPSPTAHQSENDMKLLAKALGLNDDAGEADILSAITALSSGAKSLEGKLLDATGAKSVDEALGAIKAGVLAVEQLAKTTAALAIEKAAGDKRDREAMVAKAVADKKLTPALRDWALSTEKSADGTETYKVSTDTLKGYLEKAPSIAVFDTEKKTPTEESTANGASSGKGWEDLTPAEKHNIHAASPAVYASLKADWERRGKPAVKTAQKR